MDIPSVKYSYLVPSGSWMDIPSARYSSPVPFVFLDVHPYAVFWPNEMEALLVRHGGCCCPTSNRAAKLQKLNHFRRKLPHVSGRALAAIAKAIAEEGAPDGLQNRNALRAARDSICKKT